MTPQKLLATAAICILAIALSVILIPSMNRNKDGSSGSSPNNTLTTTSADSRSTHITETKFEREDQGAAKALRELEIEFDKILPAQFPGQFSSLCDATLEPGETLVLGGFMKADGNYEFTMLEATPLGADGNPLQTEGSAVNYKVTTRTMGMSREKSSEMGLGSLISPAKTRIQKSIVFPAGQAPALTDITRVMTMPSVTTRPDGAATMSIGTDDQAYVMSLIVSPQDTGESLRIRTRIESPSED